MADVMTEEQLSKAREMLDQLLGNRAEAVAYSENPEEWVNEHGYEDVPAEAVAACGVGGGASASASSGGGGYSGPAPSPGGGVAGTLEQVDYVVYNYYGDDNSITNNIANNGYLDFDQNVQQVEGDGNILAQDGSQASGDGGVNINDSDLDDTNIQTGDGIQAGDDVDIDDSAVATGGGDAINDSDIGNTDVDVTDSQGTTVNTGDTGGDVTQSGAGVDASDDDGIDVL